MSKFVITSIDFKYSSKMSKTINTDIKNKYAFYKDLLEKRKSIFESIIDIKEVYNNANYLEEKSETKHSTLNNQIDFIVTVKKNNYKYFQFKLRCKDLTDTPFFRYDSDGIAHRNYVNKETPLKEQQITTPHFHNFNKEGLLLAYKTKSLLNEKERAALEDINLCVTHYFQESNIRLNKEDYPTIIVNSTEIPYEFEEDDPHSNIYFDSIK